MKWCGRFWNITFSQHKNQRKSELKANHSLHNQFNPFMTNATILNLKNLKLKMVGHEMLKDVWYKMGHWPEIS